MTMDNPPSEDVFPIKNCFFSMSSWFLGGQEISQFENPAFLNYTWFTGKRMLKWNNNNGNFWNMSVQKARFPAPGVHFWFHFSFLDKHPP